MIRKAVFFLLLWCCTSQSGGVLRAAENQPQLDAAKQLFVDGNYQEALDAFQQLLSSTDVDTDHLTKAYASSLECYRRLGRLSELDDLREEIVGRHGKRWELLSEVAHSYMDVAHHGYQIAGEFRRGDLRGGGAKRMHSTARDRVRALQLFQQALTQLESDDQRHESELAVTLLNRFADALLHGRNYTRAWRLQTLTDIEKLPEIEEGWAFVHENPRMAPVDVDGEPVFYSIPNSWDDAENDGQRWRWILEKMVQWQPKRRNQERLTRARFLQSQFGVETLASYGWWFGRTFSNDNKDQETGTYALHTLAENETIARLAAGIQRFDLPEEHNPLKLFQLVLDESPADRTTSDWQSAVESLARNFENRRQYKQAANYWRQAAERGGNRRHAKNQLQQIEENWGRFEPVMTQPAGLGATVDFRFRNGNRVEFTAHRIKMRELLDDVKVYLQASPPRLEWDQTQIENLGHRLVSLGQEKYLGEEVARWSLDLDPLVNHFDKRITVTTPLQEPGAYLVTSKMVDGNVTNIVLWLSDTAIVKKPLTEKALYYVADAESGRPVANCNVEFFGFWQENLEGKKFQVRTKNFAQLTDEQGLVTLPADEDHRRHQWLAVATTPEGRLAHLGFRSVWAGDYHDQQYQQVKVFSITDRPVYRPGQELDFKFWVRNAQYDMQDESRFAAQSFQVEIRDPRNEKVYSTQLIADAFGGLAGSWQVPDGATLGQYRINVVNHGGGTFRVEEYKKPEFEVTVAAPEKPIALGEKFEATISARYYFGEPVTEATVRVKVVRSTHHQRWYPPMPWDWLYGPGYWWFARETTWYPGWNRWGCSAPHPAWFWHAPTPPEVVVERELAIGPDGEVKVEIDTALAKQFHPDQDHRYEIQAEVVDQSRRTIVGNGRVLVAQQPFQVTLWPDRGYYRVGDTIVVGTAARTLDGKPIVGSGTLRLLKIQYENGEPVETEAGSWELATNELGRAELQLKASEPGQVRLSYELSDGAGHTIEGGQIITITGAGFDSSQFRYNDLEIIPDRREYQAGDKAILQINTNRTGAAVLLFLRPANGVYVAPQLVQCDGKSTTVEVEITAKDTPNVFVEAVSVHGGRVHTVVRELFVPPVKRVLNVEVVPSAEAFLPGQAAKLALKLTDEQNQPFVGSLAVAVYDKALEYISGGTNVPEIREFFWKWRRNHYSQGETNLERSSRPLVKNNQPHMQNLGIFGQTVVDEISSALSRDDLRHGILQRRLGEGGGMGGGAPMAMADGLVTKSESESRGQDPGDQTTAELVAPQIRENLADTAFWIGSLETNAEGMAEVEFDMPENLTAWKVRAWGMGHGTRVGEGTAEVVTRKNIVVRLQAPRFFVERDEVVLSANVHNYLPTEKQVRVQLALEGETLAGPEQLEKVVTIPAGGEQRVDWRVEATREGLATVRMSALTDEESDAMQMTFPVFVHGMLKTESITGVIRPEEDTKDFTVTIPAERRVDQTRLEIRYTPTLAGAMVDALPYLIDYPYGCTEQTLNRFLPAVITQQTLRRMGVDLKTIREKRTNLNSQETGDDIKRAKDWQRFKNNPVFDEAELHSIVQVGVNRLTEMQLSDGGWGWFSGWGERSYPHTTALVVHGLLVAKENNVAIVPSVLEHGIGWLQRYQVEQVKRLKIWPQKGRKKVLAKQFADNTDALVLMVLSEAQQAGASPSPSQSEMTEFLYRDRTRLAVYSLATFGMALHLQEDEEKLAMVIRNLGQYLRQDAENQTAWLELPGGQWWYWYGSEYEAHAYYLKLLVATDPESEIAPQLVKYLLNNRKHATYWNSTRDTALVVEAFADFLKATGEDRPQGTVEVWVDGKQRKQVEITSENLFSFDNKCVLTGADLAGGRHKVELIKQGDMPIYFNAYVTNFTLEDDIMSAGLELKITRNYFKLVPEKASTEVAGGHGQVVDQVVEKFRRIPLTNFAEVASGDLIEVELIAESKNDYEYILLEDMKPAGCEPVAIRSGYNDNALRAYMELRDDRVSLFVARMARGRHSVSYRLRAETPGKFSALPTRISAMYAPELKGNSDELKLQIAE